MEAFFLGLITCFVGLIILFNSAFTERGNLGFGVAVLGALVSLGGIVEILLRAVN